MKTTLRLGDQDKSKMFLSFSLMKQKRISEDLLSEEPS